MTSQQETIDNSSTSSSEITERDIEKQIAKIEDEINALSQRSKRMEKSKRTKHQAEGVMLLLWLYFVYMMYKSKGHRYITEILPIQCRTIYSQSKVRAIFIWLKYSEKLKHTIKSKVHCYMYIG